MASVQDVLTRFRADGTQTCFHGRHIEPQIYAGLDGSNWGLKDYEARAGYQAKILPGFMMPSGSSACFTVRINLISSGVL